MYRKQYRDMIFESKRPQVCNNTRPTQQSVFIIYTWIQVTETLQKSFSNNSSKVLW